MRGFFYLNLYKCELFFRNMNKKGAEMTIGTIVIIVLAIVVLVFLIFGFTTGWSNLWSKIGIYGGGEENVNDIVVACSVACTQESEYGFCNQGRDLSFGDGRTAKGSCEALGDVGGFEIDCSSISCATVEAAVCKDGKQEVSCSIWEVVSQSSTGNKDISGNGIEGNTIAIKLPEESIEIAMNNLNRVPEYGGSAYA